MKKVLINYCDENFESQRKWNTRFAKCFGSFDEIIEYGPKHFDPVFYKKNEHILQQSRGGGYWLWKPYFIVKTLNSLNDGDYLFYSDSGSVMIRKVDYLINSLEKSNQDIMVFALPLIEKQWTKRDAFVLLDCDTHFYTESNQHLATYILIKKTNFSLEFFQEYLRLSQDQRLITDIENKLGLENYAEFIDHRHDQSIYSLLSKKHNIQAFRDPSHRGVYLEPYNNYLTLEMPKSDYPTIIISNRNKNIFYYVFWFFLVYRPRYYLKLFLKPFLKKYKII